MQVRQYRGKWVADYTDQFGKRHRPSFDTKREATNHLVEAKSSIAGGAFRSEAAKTTVAAITDLFIADCRERVALGELGAATSHNYIGHAERYILGRSDLKAPKHGEHEGQFFKMPLGSLRLIDVDDQILERFRRALITHGLARGTVKLVFVTLSQIFELAKRNRWIAQNPINQFKPPKTERRETEVQIPEKDTLQKLIACATPYGQLLITFAALTGLRSGEMRALMWKDIDWERSVVRVERAIDRFGTLKSPKTTAGKRLVPLPAGLLKMLMDHRSRGKFDGLDDFVFGSGAGHPVHQSTWISRIYNPAWNRLLATPAGQGVKRCKWHALRHFAVSSWNAKGVPLKRVQQWVGHSSPQVTLNIYSHLFQADGHTDAVEEIGAEFFSDN